MLNCSNLVPLYMYVEAHVYAEENNVLFMETSALTGENASELHCMCGNKCEMRGVG